MKIKRMPIVFHQIIRASSRCKFSQWHYTAKELRNSIVRSGLYGTGPIIYQVSNANMDKQEADYTFYVPVNAPVKIENSPKFQYLDVLRLEDGLMIRHADLDEDIRQSYALLQTCAQVNGLVLEESFYHIYMDLYGDGIIDIFAPILNAATEQ